MHVLNHINEYAEPDR